MNDMQKFRFFTGSYTCDDLFPGSSGAGIQLWELDSSTGCIELISTFTEVSNPSWLAVDPGGNYLAAGSEHIGGASKVALMAIGEGGNLELIASMPSGDATCHVAFSPDGSWLASAAYVAGEVQLVKIGANGFNGPAQRFRYQGRGPDRVRQESPHAHQVVFSSDGAWLYVVDLGADRIWCHHIGEGRLTEPAHGVALPPGSGPRHMVTDQSRSRAFVISEMTGQVQCLSIDPLRGQLSHVGSLSSMPEDAKLPASCAAIHLHPCGRFLYTSNRNGGLLTGFRLGSGRADWLERIGIWQLPDPCPRDFQISPDGRWLIVAGQTTHRLTAHAIDPVAGSIVPAKFAVPCASPVCIALL